MDDVFDKELGRIEVEDIFFFSLVNGLFTILLLVFKKERKWKFM